MFHMKTWLDSLRICVLGLVLLALLAACGSDAPSATSTLSPTVTFTPSQESTVAPTVTPADTPMPEPKATLIRRPHRHPLMMTDDDGDDDRDDDGD